MNQIVVNCGNGGDFEFERDRAYWSIWISKNIPNCKINTDRFYGPEGFRITPHTDADKAIVEFDDPYNLIIFCLKKPDYVDYINFWANDS